MKRLKVLLSACLAGICIGIGGAVFLSVDSKIVGAVLFTIGLFVICTGGLHLYTGKICYIFERDKDYLIDIPIIWIGNFIGTNLVALLLSFTRVGGLLNEKASVLADVKLGDNPLSIFVLAIFCNILIYIGVDGYNNIQHAVGKYLALFFGVVVFILCGFEHVIANMFYFGMSGAWTSAKTWGYLGIMTVGNAVGGVVFPLIKKAISAGKKEN